MAILLPPCSSKRMQKGVKIGEDFLGWTGTATHLRHTRRIERKEGHWRRKELVKGAGTLIFRGLQMLS